MAVTLRVSPAYAHLVSHTSSCGGIFGKDAMPIYRDGVPKPDISTTEAFKRAVLDADSLVYNRASSGLFIEGLLKRLGLAEQTQTKTTRYTGSEMLEHVIKDEGNELAFSPITEILLYRDKGLQLADPNRKQISTVTNGTDTISAMHMLRPGIKYF